MLRDDFRMYNHFKSITVDQSKYILFFNQNEKEIEKKLSDYDTFIPGDWIIDEIDFNEFIKRYRIHYIRKAGF